NQAEARARQQPATGETERLFLEAVSNVLGGRADAGRRELQALLGRHPRSILWQPALLAVANSFYLARRSRNLAATVTPYPPLLRAAHPLAERARYRRPDIPLAGMWRGQRGLGPRPAEIELKELIRIHPDSPERPNANARLAEVQEALADHEMKVATFFY